MKRADRTTICAVASAPGAGRRAVLRLSGPDVATLLAGCCTGGGAEPAPLALDRRGLFSGRFDDGVGEQPVCVWWMPGPHSYTREDVAELHLVGSPPLVARALERVVGLGAEPAVPGEFTRRAFESGRIDLTRAEGVLALVSARTTEERRAATSLLVGGLAERLRGLRDELEGLRALAEASLDFDEADTGHVPEAQLAARLDDVLERLDEARRYEGARLAPSGAPRVVLVGAPNAGKSALFNRLRAEGSEHRALVSDLAGTTRDAKHATLELPSGVRCLLVDTAGEDPGAGLGAGLGPGAGLGARADAAGGVDALAQERTREERESADLEILVVDGALPPASRSGPDGPNAKEPPDAPASVLAWNKVDRPDVGPAPPGAIPVSALTGAGLTQLRAEIGAAFGAGRAGVGPAGLTRVLSARHRRALERSRNAAAEAREMLASAVPLDLFAEALRAATDELDQIAGRTTAEGLLDRIFSQFCIGK